MQSVYILATSVYRGRCVECETRSGAVTYWGSPREHRQWFTLWQDTRSLQHGVLWHVITDSLSVLLLSLSLCNFLVLPPSFTLQAHGYIARLKLLEAFCFMLWMNLPELVYVPFVWQLLYVWWCRRTQGVQMCIFRVNPRGSTYSVKWRDFNSW